MSAQEFREDVERALRQAVANDVSPDEIETVLDDMHDRVDRLRIVEGQS